MYHKIKSFALSGVDGSIVDVEIDIARGIPNFLLVGLPDTSIKESKERCTSAIKNSGYRVPANRIVVNLAPADIKKEGPIYDLAIAVGVLFAGDDQVIPPTADVSKTAFIGELGLDGTVRRVNGVLPMLLCAAANGIKCVIIPEENKQEASFITTVDVYAAKTLNDVVLFLRGERDLKKIEPVSFDAVKSAVTFKEDLRYVRGQHIAKRALEIAAAGGHNVLLIGPPGSGKTMLARCLPSIMPDVTMAESLEVTKLHSIAGVLYDDGANLGIVAKRPFRSPHHTASRVALVGGGSRALPGEISLAHNGVLFLDELPEYPRSCLEVLRQPLEDNRITIARAAATVDYPASFTLVASMNPCPCGYYGSRRNKCKCSDSVREKYMQKLSGPLMDRIDIHIEADGVTYDDLSASANAEPSAVVKSRVELARAIQRNRFADQNIFCNAKMTQSDLKKCCTLDEKGEKILRDAFEKLQLSARAYSRILKVARTIADMDGAENISNEHVTEAISYRILDRKMR